MVLIFPVTTERAVDYAQAAANRGDRVVGASSLPHDALRPFFDDWVGLPWFDAPEFEARLAEIIAAHGVTLIYSPHLVVWQKLSALLPRLAPGVRLDRTMPWHAEMERFRRQKRQVAAQAQSEAGPEADIAACLEPSPPLPAVQRAAVLAQLECVPGWCSAEKVRMFMDVFRHMPRGDVVEIGTFCGKSALALAWLAGRHGIGPLLCVDPWSAADMVQDNPAVNAATATLDFDEVFELFQMSMAVCAAPGGVNYLRMGSDAAAELYRPGLIVRSAEMGEVAYGGHIALLHVDGNHDLAQVRRDLDQWGRHVMPGGWIVMDDYVHAFGQGPRMVADAFLEAAGDRLAAAMVSGTALFVQLAL